MKDQTFEQLATQGNVIAMCRRLFTDQLTPVLAYRRLVAADERTAPSFLFESVETGGSIGRFSYVGADPVREVRGTGNELTIIDHASGKEHTQHCESPFELLKSMESTWRVVHDDVLNPIQKEAFTGGWVGYAGYDTMRYSEPEKLSFANAPEDDRHLPDLHFGLYRQIGVFDHVNKVLYAVHHVFLDEHEHVADAKASGVSALAAFVDALETHSVPLPAGSVDLDTTNASQAVLKSNFQRDAFEDAVDRCRAYIGAGDAFQIVISQRFERETSADPFEMYRALRVVNPSPYMIYLQAAGSILVASSPEILCRCHEGEVVNRPLAGTRKRGDNDAEDRALELDLQADEKERAEHVMLVDLGRNDLGQVCEIASITLERILEVERFSHVMHLSSTITGRLLQSMHCWDALQKTLPVGTVSGAPKIRAMQIIDELEPTRRGPYAGGIGVVGLTGNMDIAIALRTMVVPTEQRRPDGTWVVHLQAGAGIVADSDPASEYQETVNKAAALSRAIDLAERGFRH